MRPIKKDSTDQSVVIRIIDSTTGLPETGVEHDSGGIDLWYRREGATKTSITEAALAALDSAHSDGGIEHIGDGYYRLDLPDAAVATGVNGVMIGGTVTGMIVLGCYVPLVDYNPYDSVRMGMTALPNAAADAAGGLPISDAGGLDMDANTDIPAKLLKYVQLLARSDAAIATDNATELTAINADGGSGAGDFSNQTEAVEAIRDHIGDGTNLAEAGGDGDHLTAINLPNQTMDITGSLSGSVGSVTGAVGSVTADVGITQAGADKAWGTAARALTDKAGFSLAADQGGVTIGTCTTNTDLVTAAAIKTAMEADGGDLSSLMEALVNKRIWTEADGQLEMFNDSDVSQGTIAAQVSTDGTYTTAKRAFK